MILNVACPSFGDDAPQAVMSHPVLIRNEHSPLVRVDYESDGKKRRVLLLAKSHTQKGRTYHTLQVSFDDGLTWPKSHHLLLDELLHRPAASS